MQGFEIEATRLAWINGAEDDPTDLCLHGFARARIGARGLEYDATVSATALYLLKTLTEDHILHADNQMLPCCGSFMIPDAGLNNVKIVGCDHGIDWSVLHEGERVRLVLEDGYEASVPLAAYRAEVCRFADEIEAFYEACSPKQMPEDKFEQDGYTAFWNEWHRRRKQTPGSGAPVEI